MDQLLHVPQDQEIAFLYTLIMQDPNFLQASDQNQFTNTPLHLAAAEGRTLLALEIQRLMPSFGSKLNPDGFSPLDLALQRGHKETVSAMVRLNPELVCVQGREGITPLHYAAETDDVDMLAEFLVRCPDSIDKLTVREESAAHVAVKNGKLAAFRVLLGWLRRTYKERVLAWRDWEGNTVLHLAASTNQPEIMELVIKETGVNDKNSKGKTALDIVMEHPTEVNRRTRKILHRNGARRGSSICDHHKMGSFANYLSSRITFTERRFMAGGWRNTCMTNELRNVLLVVAVLVVTATYQAVLSPPGGASDQTPIIINITSIPDSSSATNITSNIGVDMLKSTQGQGDGNGKVLTQKDDFLTFMSLNSIALAASLGLIFLHLPTPVYSLFNLSLIFLLMSYMVALKVTFPSHKLGNDIKWGTCILFFLVALARLFVLPLRNVEASRRLMGNNNNNIHEMMTLVFRNLGDKR